ncbi:gamma-glutamyltranspeptidase / glutathione hydrolase [Arboricoccus pini]|uniref:Glutathione hydrolase proenzyme n=1 Tax=Arboricoccus pini TaxID=1963835 RepID=A0A212RUV2_9PROT|nr:gamma-glutamyltransferase [Arboricoccus pini]SNB76418.1 gamma-glutamyltranspeptidase / glutathione hydrolase [Arboricoccus pini]
MSVGLSAKDWRSSSPVEFVCEKRPAMAAGGMVVTNHPLASAAGAEILLAGGNAVDASVAAMFVLSVVEPMMVGIVGGGVAHLRLAEGSHHIVDALSTAPLAATPDSFTPLADHGPDYMQVEGQRNSLGAASVATPGNLKGWCEMAARYGTLPLADLVDPAIRVARRGFRISPYLAGAIREAARELALDPAIAALLLPGGKPLSAGDRLVMGDLGESLKLIASMGPGALHGGPLGDALVEAIQAKGGLLRRQDLLTYRTVARQPITGSYRGFKIIGPPPPASSGVHIVQMLNVLEQFDVAAMGFGTPAGLELLIQVMQLAFADRRTFSGDPDFVDVPVERLTGKTYARECAQKLRNLPASAPSLKESRDTTHLTIADKDGNVVAATHTINSLFGARFVVPGTGIIPNNYMSNFDPHPGKALSIAPGKRVPTSMAPMMVLKDDRLHLALGLPGGTRIFTSALQAILNILDHGMTPQDAVEAPRVWTEGSEVEIERGFECSAGPLRAVGHDVRVMPHVGGGMNLVSLAADGMMTGAACWRADGTAIGIGGGQARPGVRFWPDRAPAEADDGE